MSTTPHDEIQILRAERDEARAKLAEVEPAPSTPASKEG